MSEQPKWPVVGMTVSFLANPSSVALGLPVCDTKEKVCVFTGVVVGVAPMQPHGVGRVPTTAVTVRGQSGRVVTVDGAGVYLHEHATIEEAKQRTVPVFP